MKPSAVPQIRGYPLIQNGDVHGLDEFLGATELTIRNNPPSLKSALL
jgi:hypothetical protein